MSHRFPIRRRWRTIVRGRFTFRQPGARRGAARRVRAKPSEPIARIETANDAARVEPRKAGYFNAVQVFPYSPGALYQIYAAPGQITDIALEPGEQLIGSGPVAAGDTVRWVVGDTESGSGDTRRVHIMVKPTRPSIETNLVVNTDRRTYLIELRSREKPYMPSVAWFYPEDRVATRPGRAADADSFRIQHSAAIATRSRVTIHPGGRSTPMTMAERSTSSSRPALVRARCRRCSLSARTARPRIVNYRAFGNVLIVDRLFAAAELRLGRREPAEGPDHPKRREAVDDRMTKRTPAGNRLDQAEHPR